MLNIDSFRVRLISFPIYFSRWNKIKDIREKSSNDLHKPRYHITIFGMTRILLRACITYYEKCWPSNTLYDAESIANFRTTVYPKKYAPGFCFAVLCCGYTLTDFPISIRLTSLALWQSNDCLSASKATLMNMDKYFMWIHYERLHNHNKAKHNKTVCIFLGIYCMQWTRITYQVKY